MSRAKHRSSSAIRIGIGGWTFPDWRDSFYPADLAQKDELSFASRQVTAIEINGTYYRTQTPESFAKWRAQTPDDFVFSVKASRYATNRKVLAQAQPSIERFLGSGIAELGEKLGPIVWQFAPTKQFDADDFEAFLAMLPDKAEGVGLSHVLDVRHESFMTPEYLALARRYGAATVFADSPKFPSFADIPAGLVYIRLMCSDARYRQGYAPKALERWAERARILVSGRRPDDMPHVEAQAPAGHPSDVYIFFINGEKRLAPFAAQALLERISRDEQQNDSQETKRQK